MPAIASLATTLMERSTFIPRGWHSRGYLPHFDGGEIAQTITFRLADSLPKSVLNQWELELAHLEQKKLDTEWRRRIEDYLDRGTGFAWMRNPRIAKLIQDALLYFDGVRYKLPAWVVMPNHVHALLIPQAENTLTDVVHSWKSFTSNQANQLLGREGRFWQEDYFDRYIRHAQHYIDAIDYIENNPVKAGLCARREDWSFSSARIRLRSHSIQCGQDARAPG